MLDLYKLLTGGLSTALGVSTFLGGAIRAGKPYPFVALYPPVIRAFKPYDHFTPSLE